MSIDKKSVMKIIMGLIFLVIFNLVFFVSNGSVPQPASVWISYAFIHFAYIMLVLTPVLTRKSSSSDVFGFSIYTISLVYFIVEFVIGVIFILIKMKSWKFALIVQAILAAVYLFILISHLIANENTADSLERHEAEVAYIKEAASRVKLLEDRLPDKNVNRQIERLYDLLHTSQSRSNESVRSLEMNIMDSIPDLERAVSSGDPEKALSVVTEITKAVEERNRRLRISN